MSTVIKVENLGKKYIIGHQKQRYRQTLRDAMTHSVRGLWQHIRHPLLPNRESVELEEFWALKDINFEVQEGERIGIIGCNGAGKSTLLKVLSRITEPTTGRVRIKGRVSSLLEVGTGFHPELTGRENVFLNGAILGMSRQEIKGKFDEIIAFAEVEQFLDTPVKRYSSGMYVRLAFAVAAHLEPEILIVDEVLSVGDARFQKKCLGKMNDVAKEGRTVLFVSHNLAAVQNLCGTTLLLEDGQITERGQASQVVQRYLSNGSNGTRSVWRAEESESADGNEIYEPLSLALVDSNRESIEEKVTRDKEVFVEIVFDLLEPDELLMLGVSIFNDQGELLFRSLHTDGPRSEWPVLEKGRNVLRMRLPVEYMNAGDYRVVLDGSLYRKKWLNNPHSMDISVGFSIGPPLSRSPYWISNRGVLIAPGVRWFKVQTE